MADVQLEHGYARIARSLLRALARARFSALEHAVILAVIDQTYGAAGSPKTAPISMGALADITGRSRGRCHEAVADLERRSVLTVERSGKVLILGVSKDFDAWTDRASFSAKRSNGGNREKSAQSVPPVGTQLFPPLEHHKSKTKDSPPSPLRGDPPPPGGNVGKAVDNSTPDQADAFALEPTEAHPNGAPFDRFWQAYPRKVSKGTARRTWQRRRLDGVVDQVLAGLERAIALDPRFQSNGTGRDYCPHASTWLNAEGWQDEHAPNGAGGKHAEARHGSGDGGRDSRGIEDRVRDAVRRERTSGR